MDELQGRLGGGGGKVRPPPLAGPPGGLGAIGGGFALPPAGGGGVEEADGGVAPPPLAGFSPRSAANAAFFLARTAAKPPGSMPGRTATGAAPASAATDMGLSWGLTPVPPSFGLGATGGVAAPLEGALPNAAGFLAAIGATAGLADTAAAGAGGGARFTGAGAAGGARLTGGMSSR